MPEVGGVYVVHTTLAIPNPKDKIVVCVCADTPLYAWFNTKAAPHGHGQLACEAADHPEALTHDCYLDLSRLTMFRPEEIDAAQPRGHLSREMVLKIHTLVESGIDTLIPRHSSLMMRNIGALLV